MVNNKKEQLDMSDLATSLLAAAAGLGFLWTPLAIVAAMLAALTVALLNDKNFDFTFCKEVYDTFYPYPCYYKTCCWQGFFGKPWGGRMRQVGILCTTALVALQENVGKLGTDHKNAKTLAEGLKKIKGLRVDVAFVETNIVYLDILEGSHITTLKLGKIMEEHSILLMPNRSSRTYSTAPIQVLGAAFTTSIG